MMKTVLYPFHVGHGAKMVPFAGWEMPLQYTSIIHEHETVRAKGGLFDVSHMGRIGIDGPDAEKFLNYLASNKIAGKREGTAVYTVLCNEAGGCVDDTLVYRNSDTSFFLVANASNREKDEAHLKKYASSFDVTITPHYQSEGIVAYQGPLAIERIAHLFPQASDLKPLQFISLEYQGATFLLSRTGYTGSGGFELFIPQSLLPSLWETLYTDGKPYGVEPIGLGARDTLRLEMGYALYGHELSETTSPLESVASWTIKWDKEDFVGKQALIKKKESGISKSQYGMILRGRGIAREGYAVYHNDQRIGTVTSGTFSPSLKKAVAIICVTGSFVAGDRLEVEIRNQKVEAEIVKLPFYEV